MDAGFKTELCTHDADWQAQISGRANGDGVPGEEIVKLNAMLQDYAKKNKITYVDYHSAMKDNENGLPKSLAHDGCHPTIEGYKIMEEIVLKVLK